MPETLRPAISLGAVHASGKPFVVTRLRLRFLFTGKRVFPPVEDARFSGGVAPAAAPPTASATA
eukprot:11401391-Alexandrium_andersonii.AAC.1